jgi:hypothetical protein
MQYWAAEFLDLNVQRDWSHISQDCIFVFALFQRVRPLHPLTPQRSCAHDTPGKESTIRPTSDGQQPQATNLLFVDSIFSASTNFTWISRCRIRQQADG